MTRSTNGAARKARNAFLWCARWFLEISIALVIAGLVAAMLFGGGCSPRADVDTNGDGIADTKMGGDEIIAWRARDAAKAKADAEQVKADADEAVRQREAERDAAIRTQEAALAQAKRIQREAELAIERQNNANAEHVAQIKFDAESKISELGEQVAAAIDAIKIQASADVSKITLDATAAMNDLKASWQKREDSRTAALANIERQAEWVNAIVSDPTIRAAVGSLPGGGLAIGALTSIAGLWLGHARGKSVGVQQGQAAGEATGANKGWDDGYAAGLAAGKQQGVAEGRDIGWQERADHQKEIDATHAEALVLNLATKMGVSA